MADVQKFSSAGEARRQGLLDFQKLVARLVRDGVLLSDQANRLVRDATASSRLTTERRAELAEVIYALLVGVDDGTLRDAVEFRRCKHGLALHLDAVVPRLQECGTFGFSADQVRDLVRFGHHLLPQAITHTSVRVIFRGEADRRRAVVLHEERAWEFVGGRPKAVPVR